MLLLHSCAARLTALASDNCLSVATITRYPHRRRRDAASRHYVFSRSVVFKNRFSQFDTCVVMPFRTIRCSWASRVKALQATKAVSWRKQLQKKREEKNILKLTRSSSSLRRGWDEKHREREERKREALLLMADYLGTTLPPICKHLSLWASLLLLFVMSCS